MHYIYKVKFKKKISLNKSEQTYVWLKYTYTTATESLFLVSPSTYVYTEVVDLNISVHNLFKQRTLKCKIILKSLFEKDHCLLN